MNNDRKNRIITISIIVSFSVTLFICIFIVPIVVGFVHVNRIKKEIHNSLINFEHSMKVVYYSGSSIYYNGDHVELDDNITLCFIDDNNIIEKNNKTHSVFIERNSKYIALPKEFENLHNIFLKNDFIYSKYSNDTYYMYDIDTDSFFKISQENYYSEKDGREYSVSIKNNNIKIINSDTGKEEKISIATIFKEDTLSKIANYNYFMINDYQLYNDQLYIRLIYLNFSIIVKYNFSNN